MMKLATVGMLVLGLAVMVGCQSGAGKVRKAGSLPVGAVHIGGGMFQDLTLPNDGLLLLVDPVTQATITTTQVKAGQPIEMDMEQTFMALLMARRGMHGVGQFAALQNGGKGLDDQTAELSKESLTLQLYFVPMHVLTENFKGDAAK